MIISIITINYNNLEGLKQTIASVKSQTYANIEYIVVDGNSNDGSVEFLKENNEIFDKLIIEKDKGIYDAMNKGLKVATGEWINFMNSGDLFFSSYVLDSIKPTLLNQKYGVVYGDAKITYDNYNTKIKKVKKKNFKKGMPFCTQSALISTKFIRENRFNPSYKVSGDLDFFLQLETKKTPMLYVEKIISIFDYNGVSSRFNFKYELEKLSILKKYYHSRAYFYWIDIIDRSIRAIFKKMLPVKITRIIQLQK